MQDFDSQWLLAWKLQSLRCLKRERNLTFPTCSCSHRPSEFYNPPPPHAAGNYLKRHFPHSRINRINQSSINAAFHQNLTLWCPSGCFFLRLRNRHCLCTPTVWGGNGMQSGSAGIHRCLARIQRISKIHSHLVTTHEHRGTAVGCVHGRA